MTVRAFYDVGYAVARMPWEIGPREELVELVRSGTLAPCRAIDLGCGTGANAVHLAQQGFEVTGVDFSRVALAKARRAAARAGVEVRLVADDLTAMRHRHDPFDLLVDYGSFDDIAPARRDAYVANVVPLAAPGARFLLWGFEWPHGRRDRWIRLNPLAPGEVERRFGGAFDVERIGGTDEPDRRRLIRGHAVYLMRRRDEGRTHRA